MNEPDAPCVAVCRNAAYGGVKKRANFIAACLSLKCSLSTCDADITLPSKEGRGSSCRKLGLPRPETKHPKAINDATIYCGHVW